MEYGKDQLKSFISDSQAAFMNGQLQQAFSLAKETIKLDETVLMHISVQQMRL